MVASINKIHFRRCASLCHVMTRTITAQDVESYAQVTGDINPIHLQQSAGVVHGTFLLGLVSSVMGTKCPGPGTKVLELQSKFLKPCPVGTTVSVKVELLQERRKVSMASFEIMDHENAVFVEGRAKLFLSK